MSLCLPRLAVVVLLAAPLLGAQGPSVDTSKIGPQVGATVPAIDGVDQFGSKQTLATLGGTNGVMLVFFRSADW